MQTIKRLYYRLLVYFRGDDEDKEALDNMIRCDAIWEKIEKGIEE